MRNIFSCLMLMILAACQPVNPPAPPPLSFTRYQPIYLNVAKIDIIEEYKSPMQPPNVEHLLPTSPTEAMRIWVRDRLRATGNAKTLQITIKDASVIATPLPQPGGIEGFFTNSQDKRYDAKLDVEMRIYGGEAMSEASIEAVATRSITVAVKASVAERQAIFRRMIADLMESENAELEKNIYQYFGNSINFSHRM
jgi:hypothetical protein